ncbi:putative duf895 domain membrane protein [Botrytis fragariae]|uniref:Putative duf895 domain membrane protein n=1 Tax=Botrytis fragariae TaxID=1964551 RepID=A0A8H6EKB7_9HELO|nr:putative duf895 domain membrane protein [Botrytis fragariae]KAF5875401.1 putative duf895 domain membrane protein [Botrytis fragariae]
MASDKSGALDTSLSSDNEALPVVREKHPVKWYRSTLYNSIILGICNFLAPGIWGAMNSLGAGGEESPHLVNAANALTFCLMVLSCFFSSVLVKYIGIKAALIFGTIGYAPYAAGLYCNNRYGNEWLVLLGAALCGISAGVFWMAEAAIALSYPEPENQGRFLGLWLSFRVAGQVLGGVINLALNADNSGKGKVSYNVYLVFIALQALGPFAALLLTPPEKVQRTDGVIPNLRISESSWREIKLTSKLFISKYFLLLVPVIAQGVYSEAVMFTYESVWLSVRGRALGSFLSGIVAMISGNLLGAFLDREKWSLKKRARWAFIVILGLQGVWWIWGTVLVTNYWGQNPLPVYDWTDGGAFVRTFLLFLGWVSGFQLNYLFLYFLVGNLAKTPEEVVRIAALLRGTESAVQAVSYGLNSVTVMGDIGGVYLNFGLWGLALIPGWLLVKEIGVTLGDSKIAREREVIERS